MRRLATALSALALLWASAATLYVLSGRGAEGITTGFTLAGATEDLRHTPVSLMSADGVWIVGLLAVITLFAGLPLGVASTFPDGQRTTTWVAAVLLMGFCIATWFTVGPFYLPCAVVLLGAAVASGWVGSETPSGASGHRSNA